MADTETLAQPPPGEGADITVDDAEEEESKVSLNLRIWRRCVY